jgi:hypothetical protein
MACAKEGKCEALDNIDEVIQLSRSGESNTDRMFSNPIFTTNLKYANVIDLRNSKVPALLHPESIPSRATTI